MAASTPILRSYSTDSQKREWGKRLSLRGMRKAREVSFCLKYKKFNLI